jgi:hypothetical protein
MITFADDRIVELLEAHGLDRNPPTFFGGYRFGRDLPSDIPATETAALDAVWKAQFKRIPIQLLRKSWHTALELPVGHPRTAVVYVGHPALPAAYLPASDFHRAVFEHKVSELLLLLTNLGAVTIQVECERGWGEEMTGTLSIGLPKAHTEAETTESKQGHRRILYRANLSGSRSPILPSNLLWYPHEPLWRQVAESRMTGGLTSFFLKVEYREDYGVSLNLKTNIERLGFSVGQSFIKHQATVWVMSGSFA